MTTAAQTFRVFVSSTFTDLRAERDALQQQVFPRLRELCTLGGARFQAIDLRWGVTQEAGLDQRTMTICLEEIDRCQRMTPKPNFVVLLGDRYGWRPLPREIPVKEFERVKAWAETNASADEQARLTRWYELDENAIDPEHREVPGVYFLRPRTDEYEGSDEWDVEEKALHDLLRKSAATLEPDEQLRYTMSATEQEIVRGTPKAEGHMFAYLRQIKTEGGEPLADEIPTDDEVGKFLDLDTAHALDRSAYEQIAAVKARLRDGPSPHHDYDARWEHDTITLEHIGALPERLDACLDLVPKHPSDASDAIDQLVADIKSKYVPPADASEREGSDLCLDVWIDLATVILEEIAGTKALAPLQREIDAHRQFGLQRIEFTDADDVEEFFVGRADVLEKIQQYLRAPKEKLFAVIGDPGSGKSSLLAKAAKDAGDNAEKPAGTVIAERYIGATPESSDIRALLSQLCQEIATAYGQPVADATDYQGVVNEFRRLLNDAPSETQPLWIFLDALDQLSSAQRAQQLIWLPAAVPEHVAIVVSTLDGHDCHTALQSKRPEPDLEMLGSLSEDEGRTLLRSWLTRAGRTLTHDQFEVVIAKFLATESAGSPLYLKLAFEEARRWRSKDASELTQLNPGVDALVRADLFDRLADPRKGHGPELVESALGLLAASRFGLAEDELLDLLTDEPTVMTAFAASPSADAVEKLPFVVWSRLYFDLEPYLNERESEGVVVLGFFHRQLREAAVEDFAKDDAAPIRHGAIATYFRKRSDPASDGTWVGGYARGLSELPFHLSECGEDRHQELFETLTDFTFLERKCTDVGVEPHDDGTVTYTGVYALQEDYERALQAMGGEDAADDRRPLIITATDFGDGAGHMIRCPWCNTAFKFAESWRGKTDKCENCKGPLTVNPFIVPEPAT